MNFRVCASHHWCNILPPFEGLSSVAGQDFVYFSRSLFRSQLCPWLASAWLCRVRLPWHLSLRATVGRSWGWCLSTVHGSVHLSVPFILPFSTSVHHLPAVRQVSVSIRPRKKRRGRRMGLGRPGIWPQRDRVGGLMWCYFRVLCSWRFIIGDTQ